MLSFGKRRRSRHSRKRSLRRRSRHRSLSVFERVGNRVHVLGRGGKLKKLKIKMDRKSGREYYVSGKRKTKHYIEGKVRRRRRSFGSGASSTLGMMGNFRPPAQMSLAQATTGFSAPQMANHLMGIRKSDLSNFYTEIK